MEEAGDLLEDSWFFGNLLNTKPRTISRSYSDLASSSVCSTKESIVKNERKSSSFSSRKQPPVAPRSLARTPSLPHSIETQSFLTKNPNPNPNPNLMFCVVKSDQEDATIKNERKRSSLSSRKQPLITPLSPTTTPSLPNSIETRSFLTKNPNPSSSLSRTLSMSTSVGGNDQEDNEEEEDQESEFTLGRLIRQASMNSSHTSIPPRQTSKATTENLRMKVELDDEKNIGKMDRNRSKSTKNMHKNGGPPAIPGGWVDKNSSEDIKAHIKFWARAVASNVRQEC